MKRLIVDTSNLLFRVAAANNKHNSGTAQDLAGLAMHSSLNTLKSFYRKVQPDQVALAFEGTDNWRKDYTRSASCVSKRVYKANRVKDDSMVPFFELIRSFEQLARQHTSLVCLSAPRLEGDDVIAGYAQYYSARGDEVIILSGDKDFIQLLDLPGVSLMNPDDGKLRGTDKKTGERIDPKFFMFEKCFRGDSGDNVMSAYPRVLVTKLKKAFTNEYERTNLMNHTWEFSDPSTGEKRTYRVGDLFAENEQLMDLSKQPEDIRQLITETIEHEVANTGRFSLFEFQRFCGKYSLKKISEEAQHFIDMLAGKSNPRQSDHQLDALRQRSKAAKQTSTLRF
jgi:5'-3' exonuclease